MSENTPPKVLGEYKRELAMKYFDLPSLKNLYFDLEQFADDRELRARLNELLPTT